MILASDRHVHVHACTPIARGLLGSAPPTGCPAWKQSLDSQTAAWRYQRELESLEASFRTRAQALAASRAVEGVKMLKLYHETHYAESLQYYYYGIYMYNYCKLHII